MAISEKKMQIVIDNYFKSECDVNTSIRQAFEKGFRVGVKKGQCSAENKGEWIESKERSKHWYCSVCGGIHTDPETGKWRETFDYRYPFCPNCGADMRGE